MKEDQKKSPALLLYDATCRMCQAGSRQALQLVPPGLLKVQDINNPELQARYKITPEAAQRQMHLVTRAGKVIRGAEAVRYILYLSGWLKPLAYLWNVPGFDLVAQSSYLWVADHRYLFMGKNEPACEDGACAVHLGKVAN
ncbi:MAG: DUF393 domain-containing protein [Chloroflexota bacterium]|nr:DUF393 domain-containing protein [Chloroflexota bacterium]